MATRRNLLQILAAAGTVTALARTGMAAQSAPLQWQHFPAGEKGFFRAPVLLTGEKEAVLIDGGFTLSDGRQLVDAIRRTGKTLTTVYISQSDPDYYFGLGPVKAAFPAARVLAASSTVAAIQANVEKKLATWGPQLKDNGPQQRSEVVFAEAFDGPALRLEGHDIQIVPADGLANRRYLWVPSLQAVVGGVLVFSDLHVWTADTPTADGRARWIAALDAMAARQPAVVVPGHTAVDAAPDARAIGYTRDYLRAFDEELAKAADAAGLIVAMTRRYPAAGLPVALQIGAKVAKGEMAWG